MRFLLLISLIVLMSSTTAFTDNFFHPHDNKHHVYRTCGESLNRRVAFLCNGGKIQTEVLKALDCCSHGCTDKQLFSWCDYQL
ncbi:CRE-INS-15 protein [Caenorhabditis remanei]|uniref:CRE-INS-15 protein n=1 Tax=Caenorhabditis remanei TaxID=31234 RepID=E3LQW2_CAERE|nr:CRE-INS-15 protein [Caenorhabditis remanei]